MSYLTPLILLMISNVFMTAAWYGHLKWFPEKSLIAVIVISWLLAFFEYCFQVPANRMGSQVYSLPQLKVIQEVLTLVVFMVFSMMVFGVKPSWNHLWAFICLIGAVYFIFREGRTT